MALLTPDGFLYQQFSEKSKWPDHWQGTLLAVDFYTDPLRVTHVVRALTRKHVSYRPKWTDNFLRVGGDLAGEVIEFESVEELDAWARTVYALER